MKLKEVLWCGEGDLVLQAPLKTRKLFISRPVTNGKTAERACPGPNLGPVLAVRP